MSYIYNHTSQKQVTHVTHICVFVTSFSCFLSVLTAGKPMILVVMHYTSKVTTVGDSRRQVNNQDVLLTVDCLFHDKGLLDCDHNYKAISEVHELLGGPPKVLDTFSNQIQHMSINHLLIIDLVLSSPEMTHDRTQFKLLLLLNRSLR